MGAPDGPCCWAPVLLFVVGCAGSAIVCVFQMRLPCRRVEREQAAAKRAALVAGRQHHRFLVRRHGHVEHSRVQLRRTGDSRGRMRIDFHLPDQRARGRVHRVRIRGLIAEERRQLARRAAARPDDDGAVERRVGFEGPVRAAGTRVQRVRHSRRRGDEHAAAGDRRLSARVLDVAETERPLELEARHVSRRQPGAARVLVSRVRDRRPPARPAAALERLGKARHARAACVCLRHARSGRHQEDRQDDQPSCSHGAGNPIRSCGCVLNALE